MDSTNSRLRRTARAGSVATLLGLLLSGLVLAPASANVPEDWSDPEAVDPLHFLAVIVGLPLLLILLIALAVYLPALARGENVTPGAAHREMEWFGGPRKNPDELAAPDTEESQAGGASARW